MRRIVLSCSSVRSARFPCRPRRADRPPTSLRPASRLALLPHARAASAPATRPARAGDLRLSYDAARARHASALQFDFFFTQRVAAESAAPSRAGPRQCRAAPRGGRPVLALLIRGDCQGLADGLRSPGNERPDRRRQLTHVSIIGFLKASRRWPSSSFGASTCRFLMPHSKPSSSTSAPRRPPHRRGKQCKPADRRPFRGDKPPHRPRDDVSVMSAIARRVFRQPGRVGVRLERCLCLVAAPMPARSLVAGRRLWHRPVVMRFCRIGSTSCFFKCMAVPASCTADLRGRIVLSPCRQAVRAALADTAPDSPAQSLRP